jgi:hypothetical protein
MSFNENKVFLGKSTIAFGDYIISYTEGGVEIAQENDIYRVPDIDQISGDAIVFRSGKFIIKTTLPEQTLTLLGLAWGIIEKPVTVQGTVETEEILTLKLGKNLPTNKLTIYTERINGKKVTIVFDIARVIPSGSLGWSKKSHGKPPITFETTGDDSDIHGKVVEVVS